MIFINKISVALFIFLLGMSMKTSAHEGHSNTKAVKACHDKTPSSDCSYILGEKLYKGSCRSIASKLMCVRSEPIEFLSEDTTLLPLSKNQQKKS
jgi:hypothetical protein